MDDNINEIFSRNIMYWDKKAQEIIQKKHGIIFGLGGVGGYSAEALARAGIGKLTLVDFDDISKTNINRQIIALNSTIGQKKTELFEKRLKDINPQIEIIIHDTFYDKEKNEEIFKEKPDFVIDAIDTTFSKIELLVYCKKNNIPVFSSMGAGNRIDPSQLFIADISEGKKLNCNFTKNLIKKLEKENIFSGIICVFSKEKPKKPLTKEIGCIQADKKELKKISPSSTPFVPPVAGFFLAFCAINSIVKNIDKNSQ